MHDIVPALRESLCESHEFSVVEENAIYYAAGYVVRKLTRWIKIKNLKTMVQLDLNLTLASTKLACVS